jgi:ribosome-associated translation inhibitor RaiA
MPVRITARRTTVSETTKAHIEEAYAKLEHFCDRIVHVPKQTLIGTAKTEDDNLFRSLDEAYSHVERQLKKYHDKTVDHR